MPSNPAFTELLEQVQDLEKRVRAMERKVDDLVGILIKAFSSSPEASSDDPRPPWARAKEVIPVLLLSLSFLIPSVFAAPPEGKPSKIIADAVLKWPDYVGTDNSDAIEEYIRRNSPEPWGCGGDGGTLELPSGTVGITRRIMLPSTFGGLNGMPTKAIRIKGEGSNATYLVYLGDSDEDKDCLISWQFADYDVEEYEDAGDGNTWIVFDLDWLRYYHTPRGSTTKKVQVEILGGPYTGIHDAIGRELDRNRVSKIKLKTQFKGELPNEPSKARFLCNAEGQKISGLHMRLPRNEGAVGIYRKIWDADHWATHSFNDYSWHQVGHQRLQLDLDDVTFFVDSAYNPAAIRVEGSWLQSTVHNTRLTGFRALPYHYDTFLIWCQWRHPRGRPFPADILLDGVGLSLSRVTGLNGGNMSGFQGRALSVIFEVGFLSGGGKSDDPAYHQFTGLPTMWLRNSNNVRVTNIGNEGQSEKPAETVIERSVGVVVEGVVGGGVNKHFAVSEKVFGDAYLIKDSIRCRIEDRRAPGHYYGWFRRHSPQYCDNPGETALLRIVNSRFCEGVRFDMDLFPSIPNSQWFSNSEEQLKRAIRIDKFSLEHGCKSEGTFAVTGARGPWIDRPRPIKPYSLDKNGWQIEQ